MISDGWAELCHLNVINVDFTGCHFADACTEGISKECKQRQRQGTQTVSRWASLAWFQLEAVRFNGAANATMLDLVARCHELREIVVWINPVLDASWEGLPQARWPNLRVAEFVSCFRHSQIVTSALQVLATCPKLERLRINLDFSEEPSQVLNAISNTHWPELRDVDFDFRSGKAAMAVLQSLAKCSQLEKLCFQSDFGFDGASLGDVEAWEQIREGHWPKLRSAAFTACVRQDNSQGFATEVLNILARCSELQSLNVYGNKWPTTQEWDEKLEQGCWPKLRWEECDFGSNCPSDMSTPQQATTVTGQEEPATAESGEKFPQYLTHVGGISRASQLHSLALCRHLQVVYILDFQARLPASAWLSLEMATWPELRVVTFSYSFAKASGCVNPHLEGAHAALGLLARCKLLEEIDLSHCDGIPAEAWERLRGVEWPVLKKAKFVETFNEGTPSCSKAAMVLGVLGKCSQLVELRCKGTSAEAFTQLPDGCWPLLESVGIEGLERLCRTEEGAADSTAILVLEKDTQTEPQGPGAEIADSEDHIAVPEKAKMKPKKKKRWVTKTNAKRQNANPPASSCE